MMSGYSNFMNLKLNPSARYRKGNMSKYLFLGIIYLVSVISSSAANSMGTNVQVVYRVPFLNIRWIDLAIILIIMNYFVQSNNKYNNRLNNSIITSVSYIFLIFETFQFIRSWQATDINWQIAGFLCTLTIFIIIDLSTFKIEPDRIIRFLKDFSLWGSLVLTVSNTYLFYAFLTGNVILDSSDVRVSIEIIGSKESVSTQVLTPFVYAFGFYFTTNKIKSWKKIIYISAIISIYVTQVIVFERGVLFMIACITIYFLIPGKKLNKAFTQIAGIVLLMAICYFLFVDILREKGYDPVEKIIETAQFAVDVSNPNWDKGRNIPREYALNAWENNIWFGVGYDELQNYGLPEGINTAHNFIITSLFHRGIIGTCIYLFILFLLFKNSIQLWLILKKEKSIQNDLMKLLIIVSFLWLIPFWTQEAHWEKYSLSIQFMYLGFITNYYNQVA